MILYCIVKSKESAEDLFTYKFLKKACEERSIEFVPLETEKVDYSKVDTLVEPGSLLYRMTGGQRSALLEALVYDKVITIRKNIEALLSRGFLWGSAIRLQQAGLPIIPTIFNIHRTQDESLISYAEKLGGFPIVAKVSGGSHGAGVMRFDSAESLRSVMDVVADTKAGDVALRKYISNARHLRVVVLNGKVLDVIEYQPQPNDFRTNAVRVPQVKQVSNLSSVVKNDTIAAVDILGLGFGGVDVLIDEQGQHFIAEVNHPCNFARNQQNTGVDIAGALVDSLIEKAQLARQ